MSCDMLVASANDQHPHHGQAVRRLRQRFGRGKEYGDAFDAAVPVLWWAAPGGPTQSATSSWTRCNRRGMGYARAVDEAESALALILRWEQDVNRDEILGWLLEEDNPPVRLMTLTQLLHQPEADADVQEARSHLMDYSVTQGILAHSDEILHSGPRTFWSYRGRYWNTVYLGLFLADGQDPRITEGLQLLLGQRWVSDRWHCMTACLLRAFRRLGYGDHPTVIEGTESLAQRLLDANGLTCSGMGTSLLPYCYMTLPKLLLCFGEVPAAERSPAIREAIAWIVRQLVGHQVYIYVPGNRKAWDAVRPRSRRKADAPEGETPESWRAKVKARFLAEHGLGALEPKPIWTRFGFPLNHNSDILEAMLALAMVDTPMSGDLERPLRVIRDRRTADGVWPMDKSLNGQMWADVEVKGQPSKWLTLFALIVLDHFGQASWPLSEREAVHGDPQRAQDH